MEATRPVLARPDFGKLIGVYRPGPLRIVMGLTGILSLAAGLFFSFIFGHGLLNPSDHQKDPAAGFVIVFFFLAGAVYALWTFYGWRGTQARLYESGLIISGGGETNVIAWDAITSVTQPATWMTFTGVPSQRYRVTTFTGKTIEITEVYSRVAQLGDDIQRMSANTLLPRAIAACHSGAVVPFGPIHVSQSGISHGAETLPLSEVERVSVGSGYLFIFRRGDRPRWATVALAKIPNLYVLTALVDYLRSQTQAGG